MKRTKLLTVILAVQMLSGCSGNSDHANVHEGGNYIPQEYLENSSTDDRCEAITSAIEAVISSTTTTEATSITEPVEEKNYDDVSFYKYEENDDGGITITEYLGEDDKTKTTAVIPAVIDGKPVTVIGEWAFNDCIYLTRVEIPDSVIMINDNAFYMCSSLETIELSDNIYWIGENAFLLCSSLTNIQLPDYLFNIGMGAFWSCTSLTSIEIPDMVTEIPRDCFRECHSLTSVELPANLERIGIESFFNCKGLKNIEIPDSIYSIADSAFNWCDEDLKIHYSGGTYNPDSFSEYIKSLNG